MDKEENAAYIKYLEAKILDLEETVKDYRSELDHIINSQRED